jgi:hypothetical protein
MLEFPSGIILEFPSGIIAVGRQSAHQRRQHLWNRARNDVGERGPQAARECQRELDRI